MLLTYGLKDQDYSLDDKDNPVPNPKASRAPSTCRGNTSPGTRR